MMIFQDKPHKNPQKTSGNAAPSTFKRRLWGHFKTEALNTVARIKPACLVTYSPISRKATNLISQL